MGSRSAFEDLTELLSGTRASESSEIDKMCAEVTTKGFKSSIEGYNGNYLVVDCAIILDNKGVQDCTANPRTEFPDRHKSVSGIQTLAWTDNKENLVVVRCSHKGDKNDWVLYSFNTSISDEIKKTVEHQVSRMGFRPSEYPIHYSDYSNCNLTKGDD
ncbi:uncharacterized protein LOC118433954 [Folsomia candida]|nr:uncharacterized protein LOC118433954 [Folsomia candida]